MWFNEILLIVTTRGLAFAKSGQVNWNLSIWFSGGKYEPIFQDNAYKVSMKLNINAVSSSDFGTYKCVAKNALGDTDGTIKLYSELSWNQIRLELTNRLLVFY